MRRVSLHLRESDVSKQIRDFLEFRGWRVIRMNVTKTQDKSGRWTSFGEVGQPDYLCLFYKLNRANPPGCSVALWVEVKQKGGKLREVQAQWHRDEALRGATVVVADDFRDFESWYWECFGWVHQLQSGQGHLFQPAAGTQ